MRTVKLTKETKNDLLESLLKRSPNNYGQYESVVNEIIEKGIVLELCPTSNINTKIFNDIRSYPITTLIDKGVKVTINTDNTTVSNTDIEEEYIKMIANFGFNRKDVENLCRNAIESTFLHEKEKRKLCKKIDKFKF